MSKWFIVGAIIVMFVTLMVSLLLSKKESFEQMLKQDKLKNNLLGNQPHKEYSLY